MIKMSATTSESFLSLSLSHCLPPISVSLLPFLSFKINLWSFYETQRHAHHTHTTHTNHTHTHHTHTHKPHTLTWDRLQTSDTQKVNLLTYTAFHFASLIIIINFKSTILCFLSNIIIFLKFQGLVNITNVHAQ